MAGEANALRHVARLKAEATYRLPERRLTLAFDEGLLAGAEMVCDVSDVPTVYFAVLNWIGKVATAETKDDRMSAGFHLARAFDPYLRSWNLVGALGPVPASAYLLDLDLLVEAATAWRESFGEQPLGAD